MLVAIILGLLLFVGGGASIALLLSARTVNSLATGYTPAADANGHALTYMLDAETGIRGYAVTGRSADLAPYRAAVNEIVPAIDSIKAALARVGNHGLDAKIAAERTMAQLWIAGVGEPATASLPAARRIVRAPSARARFDTFRAANQRVASSINTRRDALSEQSTRERDIVLPLIAGVVIIFGVAAVIALRTARGVSRPLTAVWAAVQRLEAGDLTARADQFSGPAEIRELAAAVNDLAVERRRALAAQLADDELRREVRGVTSAIRIGQDAHAMTRALVAGLGRTYDVDRVWLQTFDEDRVAVISEQWRRGRRVANIAPRAEELAELSWLANRLWHAGTVIGVSDHAAPPTDTDAYVLRAPNSRGAKASAVVPIGEGGKAIGLLWLSSVYEPRVWSAAELGLLQHVAAELAQNLVQNHVLTQQRDAMRRLREADEAKTALVSTVSHELRTPLTSIIGYLDVLLDMDGTDIAPDVVEMLRVVDRNAHRLRALIEDLLTQSQIEAGRRLVQLSRVDLVDVLREVEDTIEPLADNAHLGFEVRLPPRDELVIDGDPRQLGQAVTNLAANAVKFTPRGGRVTVSAVREYSARGVDENGSWAGDEAVVRVTDTGIGIPAEEIPQLFDRFFRATNARKAVIQGTGLGLAIVAEIVAQHHGTVHVESELGVGTTFVIRLPLTTEDAIEDTLIDGAETDPPGTVEGG